MLDAALVAGLALPYSCRRGDCDSCACTLLEGQAEQRDQLKMPGELILSCEARPLTDCRIDAEHLPELADIKPKLMPAKISELSIRTDVAVLKLRTAPGSSLPFLEGQYLDIVYAGLRRSYSIASTAHDALIELHIKRVDQGLMSAKVFDEFKLNTLLRINGPFGSFFVRDSQKPLIFLATGTGFAPVQAMVAKLIADHSKRDIYIYWGNRYRADFYTELPLSWAAEHPNIHFRAVISREADTELGQNTARYVQDAVIEDGLDVAAFDVYACGSTDMIHSAKNAFVQRGLNEGSFYSDAFIATS